MNNKVEFEGIDNERAMICAGKNPQGVLTVGKEYEIYDYDVGGWSTIIYLKEFPNISFNSVFFEIDDDHWDELFGEDY